VNRDEWVVKLPPGYTTWVAVPGIIPSVGPTAYVFPLSHTAETVRWVGVAITEVIFQPKVMHMG